MSVGAKEGLALGEIVGERLGVLVGERLGVLVGSSEGLKVGVNVGWLRKRVHMLEWLPVVKWGGDREVMVIREVTCSVSRGASVFITYLE